jgi:glycosyltransferase involved in cell wall biosynthesis
VNGLLVPARDATALAAALETLIRTPALRVAMGAASRQLAVQEFSSAQVIRETKLVYEDVLGRRELAGRNAPLPRPVAGVAARVAA